ncbi:DUF2147 domain-containing protein [Reyranella sp.]|uniref:DUF2147 domain-containing protein n=1 Tax=Reyranella sp. TaxID=1929291 RepID=UPI003BAD870F
MKKALVAVALATAIPGASAQQASVMGVWLTQSGLAHVRLAPCAQAATGALCGTVVGLVNPKGPNGAPVAPDAATDYRNPDPAQRTRKVIGMPIMWGFKPSTDGRSFEDGKIYNGENGKVYSANVSLETDGRLRLRGFVGNPIFGETQYWTRVN